MKKYYILVALAMLAAFTMVGCKNKKSQEPTPEEIQAQKQALADSVLAKIDSLADYLIDTKSKSFSFHMFELTDAEKLVKPDYLLDPAEANKFVTKSQKISALAIYHMEMIVRDLYDMPVDEVKEAIARLAADLNFPDVQDMANVKEKPISERMREQYSKCKANEDLATFWQYREAIITELNYLTAQNPDLFFSKITEEQWQAFCLHRATAIEAIETLSKYDSEMAKLNSFINLHYIFSTREEANIANATKESAKMARIANKNKFTARRNALLQ